MPDLGTTYARSPAVLPVVSSSSQPLHADGEADHIFRGVGCPKGERRSSIVDALRAWNWLGHSANGGGAHCRERAIEAVDYWYELLKPSSNESVARRGPRHFEHLTRWIRILDRTARATGDNRFIEQALHLAETTRCYFPQGQPPNSSNRPLGGHLPGGGYPMEFALGAHCPLEGYVSLQQLRATLALRENGQSASALTPSIAFYESLLPGQSFETSDPLALGRLLVNAFWLSQIAAAEGTVPGDIVRRLLCKAFDGYCRFGQARDLKLPANQRLAFRELSLATGLSAVALMLQNSPPAVRQLRSAPPEALVLHAILRFRDTLPPIVRFWQQPASQCNALWRSNQALNESWLAAALHPAGLLTIPPWSELGHELAPDLRA